MPLYEFKNEQTGEIIEELFPITDIPDKIENDNGVYKRVTINKTSFRLKGSGWESKGRL